MLGIEVTRMRVWALVFALFASSASAQAPARQVPLSDSLMGQAKLDYEAARILIDDQDYGGASVKFRQAFDHSGDVRLLWNVAVCEKSLRHYANVLRLLERYQREGGANMTAAQRSEVKAVLDTVRTLISAVHLTVDQPGAVVYVDDQPAGTTPLSEPLLIDLGSRRIRVTKPGFQEQVIVHNFTGGSELTFNVALQSDAQEGRLSVFSASGTTISVDGTLVGGGHWEGSLPEGEHSLRVAAAGMQTYQTELVIRAGEPRTLHVSLQSEASGVPAWVWISTGVVVAGGLAVGGYFLLRGPQSPSSNEVTGTLTPGTVQLP
jgi:hypothetical protein